ncbi:MAG: PKD domain-containing protein [bacterium]
MPLRQFKGVVGVLVFSSPEFRAQKQRRPKEQMMRIFTIVRALLCALLITGLYGLVSCGGSSTTTTFDPGLTEVQAYGDVLIDVPGHPGERLEVQAIRTETGDGNGVKVGGDIKVPANQTGVTFSGRTWSYFKYAATQRQQLDTIDVLGNPLARYSLTLQGYPPIVSWSAGGPDTALEAMASQYPKNVWIPYEFLVWAPAESMGHVAADFAGWEIKPGTFTVTKTENNDGGFLGIGGAFGFFLASAIEASATVLCPSWKAPGRIMFVDDSTTPPPAGNPAVVNVTLSPAGPYDPDQQITIYVWMVNGPGTWPPDDVDFQWFTIVSHAWDATNQRWIVVVRCPHAPGSYLVWRTVVVVVVGQPAQNQAPNAALTATPLSGSPPLTVSFNANGSSDSDGTITAYEWDPEGDGTFTDGGPTFSHQYTSAGTFSAAVRVRDNDGATDTATVTITVSGGAVVLEPIITGTNGVILNGGIVSIDEGNSEIVSWQLRNAATDAIVATINPLAITHESVLPFWVFDDANGEVDTALWANPSAPDPTDPENVWVNPGDFQITSTFMYSGTQYQFHWTLRVVDRDHFPSQLKWPS